MRLLMIDQLVAGARLGKTLYAEDGRALLHRGTELTDGYLEALWKLGYRALYVLDPHSEDLEARDPISERTRQEAITAVRDVFRQVREPNPGLDQEWTSRRILYNTAVGILNDLQGNRDLNLQVAELRTLGSYTFNHSVNTCVLGLALGERLGLPYGKLADLAMGLLLHDVGKTALGEGCAEMHEGAEQLVDATYRRHPRIGFDIAQQLGKTLSSPAKIVVLQHHERHDGSGFPKGLKGDEIHLFGRIAAIANTYDNLIHDLGLGRPTPPHQAMEYLMAAGGSHFDHALVVAFLKLLVPFPLEAAVRLSTAEEGLVVAIDRGLPMRPTIRVTMDPDGTERRRPYELDLKKHPDITIVQAY
ncbi:MAG TPA: HD domain-containing phosphohydrolase [Pantanalinema sp.]